MMAGEGGKVVYDLSLENQGSSVVSGFNIMINKNAYGLEATPPHVADLAPVHHTRATTR